MVYNWIDVNFERFSYGFGCPIQKKYFICK